MSLVHLVHQQLTSPNYLVNISPLLRTSFFVHMSMHLRIRKGARLDGVAAARPQRLDRVDDDQNAEQGPQEEAERNGGLDGAAVVVVAAVEGTTDIDGQGNAAGEPKDHGDPFEGERGEAVENAGVVEGGQTDVQQD